MLNKKGQTQKSIYYRMPVEVRMVVTHAGGMAKEGMSGVSTGLVMFCLLMIDVFIL
jgi:hypothetical protein